MDVKSKNNVKNSTSNYSLSTSFNAVRMHDLKESSDENDNASISDSHEIPNADGSELPEVQFKLCPPKVQLRRASSDLLQKVDNGPSSGKQFFENRFSADILPAKLQNLANDTKEFLIRRRTKPLSVSKSASPEPVQTLSFDSSPVETPEDGPTPAKKCPPAKQQTPEVAQEAVEQLVSSKEISLPKNDDVVSPPDKHPPPGGDGSKHNLSDKERRAKWTYTNWILGYWRQIFGLLLIILTFADELPYFLLGLSWGVYLCALVCAVIMWFYIPAIREENDRYKRLAESAETTHVTDEDLLKTDSCIYKGWMNLLKGPYDPTKYNIKSTRSVLIRLDKDVVRLSFPKINIAKHNVWNEQKIDSTFVSQELFNIAGAVVTLKPKNLAKRRWWSRKYPICITFKGDSLIAAAKRTHSDPFVNRAAAAEYVSDESDDDVSDADDARSQDSRATPVSQDSRSHESHASHVSQDGRSRVVGQAASVSGLPVKDPDTASNASTTVSEIKVRNRKHIFLFARSNREKEQWFHQLRKAAGLHSYQLEHGGKGWWSESEMEYRNLSQQAFDWILYTSIQKQFAKTMGAFVENSEPKDVMLMDLGFEMWKPTNRVTTEMAANEENITWVNALAARVFLDFSKDNKWIDRIKSRVERKMATIKLPYFIETLKLAKLEPGSVTPRITGVYEPTVNEWGLWVDVNIEYSGGIHLMLETKLNLMKLKTETGSAVKRMEDIVTHYSDEDVPESPESSSGDDEPKFNFGNKKKEKTEKPPKESTGKKILHFVDKITQSKVFQDATENKYLKKLMQGVSDTPLVLTVDVAYMEGTMALNIPCPPSDRIWYGFRCPPKVVLRAKPKVGDRSLNVTHVTEWIENKMILLLEKFLVLPNMDDMIIPVMSGSPLFKDINK